MVKSCLIWMVLTFLEMGADSGSNRPIKVINSPLFKLALEDNNISPDLLGNLFIIISQVNGFTGAMYDAILMLGNSFPAQASDIANTINLQSNDKFKFWIMLTTYLTFILGISM